MYPPNTRESKEVRQNRTARRNRQPTITAGEVNASVLVIDRF